MYSYGHIKAYFTLLLRLPYVCRMNIVFEQKSLAIVGLPQDLRTKSCSQFLHMSTFDAKFAVGLPSLKKVVKKLVYSLGNMYLFRSVND